MLFSRPTTSTVEEVLDKFAVKELIEYERFCRDNALWPQMRTCYAPDSVVTISWYQGSGFGFVDASGKMAAHAPHKLNNTLIWLNGNRAVAVTMACIQTRAEVGGRPMDMSSYVRLLYSLRRVDSTWEILSLDSIYEKDCLTPAAPEGLFPSRPGIRESYANLSEIMGRSYAIADDLPGDDRPETTTALLDRLTKFLDAK